MESILVHQISDTDSNLRTPICTMAKDIKNPLVSVFSSTNLMRVFSPIKENQTTTVPEKKHMGKFSMHYCTVLKNKCDVFSLVCKHKTVACFLLPKS